MGIHSRSTYSRPDLDSGPYEAIVLSHLDPKYMGGLKVELLKMTSSGNLPERTGQTFEVRYLSPFYGSTPVSATNGNDGYENSQKSYGMWFVPPDVGTRVLVIFAEGNPGQGFWIGCVPDTYMNFMVPGEAATKFTDDSTPGPLKGKKLPTAEYNKKRSNTDSRIPTVFKKPYHKEFVRNLIRQGVLEDEVRGLTTSSARREVPSSVFGINTPGPVDKRNGSPKHKVGPVDSTANVFINRLGGSSLVFDDGDDKLLRKGSAEHTPQEYVNVERGEKGGDVTQPHNEHVRLRTRTGHQILLHNTEDLIYISNARGTAWVELTSNGKIDIYSQDSVSVHSAQDLNFTADRDINMTCGENMNFVVGKQMRTDVGDSVNLSAGTSIASNAGTSITENANTFITNYAVDSITHTAKNENITILSGNTINVGAKNEIGIEADNNIEVSTDKNFHIKTLESIFATSGKNLELNTTESSYITTVNGDLELKTGGWHIEEADQIHMNGPSASTAQEANLPPIPKPVDPLTPIRAAQTARVPLHEPWPEHENLDPLRYVPEKTRAGLDQIKIYPASVYDTFDVRTEPAFSKSVARTQESAEYDATTSPRDVSTDNQRAYGGTPTPNFEAAGIIDGFTEEETKAYLEAIGERESNNSYDAVNTIGFAGKYQFGTAALKEAGLIKMSASNSNSEMNNPDNWTGRYDVNSLDDWLNSPEAQEKAMITYSNKNRQYLIAKGGIRESDSKEVQAGMLAGAHLLGAGGMTNWRRGNGGRDAYGTTGDEYFQIGKTAIASASTGAVA